MPGRSRGSPLGRPPGRYPFQQPRDATTVAGASHRTHAQSQSQTPVPRRTHNRNREKNRRQQRQRELKEDSNYLDSWLAPAHRETFLLRNIALEDQGKSERRRQDNISSRKRGTATGVTIGRHAPWISEEHKKEFQPVHKVYRALQPAHEWRHHQKMLRHNSQSYQKDSTNTQLLNNTKWQNESATLHAVNEGYSNISAEIAEIHDMIKEVARLLKGRIPRSQPRNVPFWRWGDSLHASPLTTYIRMLATTQVKWRNHSGNVQQHFAIFL